MRSARTGRGARPTCRPAAAWPPSSSTNCPDELLSALEDAARRAHASVREPAASDPALRDGELFQITHDHTVVQSLIDEGRIGVAEAASHPQRALLLRAVGGGSAFEPEPALRDALAGDRYLLCSDGLSGVVAPRRRSGASCARWPIRARLRSYSLPSPTARAAPTTSPVAWPMWWTRRGCPPPDAPPPLHTDHGRPS